MKYEDLKVGMKLKADGGFTCIDPEAELEVKKDEKGNLYVDCRMGKHFLDGQIDFDTGDIVGLEVV